MNAHTISSPHWQDIARQKAERATRARLRKALRRSDKATFADFISGNFDSIEAWMKASLLRRFHNLETLINIFSDSKDSKSVAKAARTLRALADDYVREKGTSKAWLKRLKVTPESESRFEKRLKHNALHDWKAHISRLRASTNIRKTSSLPAYMLGALWHGYSYVAHKRRWSTFKKFSVPPLALSLIMGGLSLPVYEHPHTTAALSAAQSFRGACDARIVNSGDILTAAIAVAFGTDIQNNANAQAVFLASLQGLNNNVSPISIHAIAHIESSSGNIVRNPQSSAEGLFQVINATAIDWMARHHENIPKLADARERLAADNYTDLSLRDDDLHNVMSVEQAVAAYRRDPEGVTRNIHNNRIDSSMHTTLTLARNALVSAQLMTEEINASTPALRLSSLSGNPQRDLQTIAGALADRYRIHLLGDTGARYLDHLANHAPNVIMNNRADVERALRQAPLSASPYMANYMADNFVDTMNANGGIFTGGQSITATTFKANIDAFSGRKIATYEGKIRDALRLGDSASEICIRQADETLRASLPGRINMWQVWDAQTGGTLGMIGTQVIATAAHILQQQTPAVAHSDIPLPRQRPATFNEAASPAPVPAVTGAAQNVPMPVPRPADLDGIGSLITRTL